MHESIWNTTLCLLSPLLVGCPSLHRCGIGGGSWYWKHDNQTPGTVQEGAHSGLTSLIPRPPQYLITWSLYIWQFMHVSTLFQSHLPPVFDCKFVDLRYLTCAWLSLTLVSSPDLIQCVYCALGTSLVPRLHPACISHAGVGFGSGTETSFTLELCLVKPLQFAVWLVHDYKVCTVKLKHMYV